MQVNKTNGRYHLGDSGHLLGMQGVSPMWLHQWTGPGGRHSPFAPGISAFDRYYPGGLHEWVEDQADLVLRSGVRLLTQWTEINLAIRLSKEGVAWVPVLMPNEETKRWVQGGCDIEEGVSRVRNSARSLRESIEGRGEDYRQVLSGVIDWQEVIWDALRYEILLAPSAIQVAQELFPRCAAVIREELPGIPVWGPKLAGSTMRDHPDWGWDGWKGSGIGERGHRWSLLKAASEDREVLCLNCYGDRGDHRLADQHEWTGLPIVITEFAHWTLSRKANPFRWGDFKVMGRSKRFNPAPSSEESASRVAADLIHDASSSFIMGSILYLWSHHAWDWGFAPNQPLFGYLGHVVDPTRPNPGGRGEWRDEGWISRVGVSASEADALARKLRL